MLLKLGVPLKLEALDPLIRKPASLEPSECCGEGASYCFSSSTLKEVPLLPNDLNEIMDASYV